MQLSQVERVLFIVLPEVTTINIQLAMFLSFHPKFLLLVLRAPPSVNGVLLLV